MSTPLDYFNDGRQCAVQAVLERIELSNDIVDVERFCREYLENVLAHGREAA